ncbi:MAG: LLM class flavin-dependent oxidoreductase [Gemmatimonadaceae bacterium]
MTSSIEFGLDTFGDVTLGADGLPLSHAQVIRNVIAEAELADSVGIDAFGVGEHHRPDFAISAPEVMLAAIAGRTRTIRLGSSVTVLSTDDPVRVYERFTTLDGASGGRAEVILGRGSFTESYPLFGYDLGDYQALFEDKLALFMELLKYDRTGEPVTWKGRMYPALDRQRPFPRTESGGLAVSVGVGGSPESVVRAARHALPLTLAIIGGDPRRFLPYIQLYYQSLDQRGHGRLPVAVHSHGYVAESDAQARAELFEPWRDMRNRIGAERGWPSTTMREFEHEVEGGSLYVGAPDTVARRIAATVRALGLARFTIKYSAGTLAHQNLMRCIELFGREVIPRVRELLAGQPD